MKEPEVFKIKWCVKHKRPWANCGCTLAFGDKSYIETKITELSEHERILKAQKASSHKAQLSVVKELIADIKDCRLTTQGLLLREFSGTKLLKVIKKWEGVDDYRKVKACKESMK